MWKIGDILVSHNIEWHDEISIVLGYEESERRLIVLYRRPPVKLDAKGLNDIIEIAKIDKQILGPHFKYAL